MCWLGAAMAEMGQSGQHRLDVVEQIAQHDHDPPLLEPLGQVVEDRAGGGFSLGRGILHGLEQLLQVRRVAAGADQRANLVIERDQARAVLLLKHQVRQRGRQADAILEFR